MRQSLGPGVGPNLDTVWVQPGHGVDPTWTRCGSILDTVWVQPGLGVGLTWTRCVSNLDTVWVQPGHSVGPNLDTVRALSDFVVLWLPTIDPDGPLTRDILCKQYPLPPVNR